MKTKLFVSGLFLVLILGIIAPHASAAVSPPSAPLGLTIEVQRTITSGPFGVMHITDLFNVTNDGTGTPSFLDFGFLNHPTTPGLRI